MFGVKVPRPLATYSYYHYLGRMEPKACLLGLLGSAGMVAPCAG